MKLMTKKKRKGFAALWNVLLAGVIFVALAITLSIGADVTYDIGQEMTDGSLAQAAANNSTLGIANLAKWQPTMGTVIAAGAIISIIMTAFIGFAVGRARRGGRV